MDQGQLVGDQIVAGERLVRAFESYRPLAAAFWVKEGEPDDNHWYLYLVPEQIDEANRREIYHEIHRLWSQLPPNVWLGLMQVRLADPQNRMAHAVISEQNLAPVPPEGRRLGGSLPGGVYVLDGYLYPLTHSVSS
jgi:hypothetical protein